MANKTVMPSLLMALPLQIDLSYISANYGEGLAFGAFTAILLLLVFIMFILGSRQKNPA